MSTPQTRVLGGNGTNVVSYELAPGVYQKIESVYVELNNGAVVAVQPLLQVRTQNGAVIAAQRQSGQVPAGQAGSATWALRLGDNADTSGFLKWGVNTDSAAKGLTLAGAGAYSFSTGGFAWSNSTSNGAYSINTGTGFYSVLVTNNAAQIQAAGASGQVLLNNQSHSVGVDRTHVWMQGNVISLSLADPSGNPGQELRIQGSPSGPILMRVQVDGEQSHRVFVAGGTFYWNDAAGNPIFRLTG